LHFSNFFYWISLQNKWEHVSERQLDIVLDHLNTLNDLTPKIRCQGRNGVDPNLIFGIWSERFLEEDALSIKSFAHDEVETVTVYRGPLRSGPHDHGHHNDHCKNHSCCKKVSEITMQLQGKEWVEEEILLDALGLVGKEIVWRVKGFVRLRNGVYILNWAFGRYDLKKAEGTLRGMDDGITILFTGMGERGEVKQALRGMITRLGATLR
jgi:G3E family GTPase